jgi:hypothetical protein
MFYNINGKLLRVTGFNGKDPVTHEFKFGDGTPADIEVSPDGKNLTIKKINPDGTVEPVVVLVSD